MLSQKALNEFKQIWQEEFNEQLVDSQAESLLDDYFKGTAKINPRELFAKLNDLKDLIFPGS